MLLDIRTMIVMTALLAAIMALLLCVASCFGNKMHGVRYWALAELSIGLGLGLAYFMIVPAGGLVVMLGSIFVVLGMCAQLAGIQAFIEVPVSRRLILTLFGLAVGSNAWFDLISPNVEARVISNSLVFAVINGLAARLLLVKVEHPARIAYWFTGGAFAAMALLFLVRALIIMRMPEGTYSLYSQASMNPASFFVGSVLQMVQVFGFILMVHFKVSADLQRLATRDSLTGIFNRRSLEEQFGRMRALHHRTGEALAIMMIDIDHFKQVNDRYGHLAGDHVLRGLARLIESDMREQDYLARYGGEEFCILMPATTEEEAVVVAERLRQSFAETPLRPQSVEQSWFSTISIGVADSRLAGLEFSGIVAAADRALYEAKHSGRNRVVAATSITPLKS